ncbi:glutaredoxin family protein [Halofilum ochraceum]|uniref:glutaredoxin family protein n=1 Tax=Halofilum ochraceum TaxID=1611323 RepID=UPI00082F8C09|nr:glutathione S-transferase N-terminal domain-containing protein [Halofilum ochraceum]
MLKQLKERVDGLRERAGVPVRTPEQQAEVERRAQHLTLYHRPTCPFCMRVFIALARLDIPIQRRNITTDAEARTELGAGGGRQQVPCLRIDESAGTRWLYESADIIAYLEAQFGVPD